MSRHMYRATVFTFPCIYILFFRCINPIVTGDFCLYQILVYPLSGQGSIFDWGGRDLGALDVPTKTQHGHTNTSLGNLKKMESTWCGCVFVPNLYCCYFRIAAIIEDLNNFCWNNKNKTHILIRMQEIILRKSDHIWPMLLWRRATA